MSSPALTGACACGAVRFEVDEPLVAAAYCHCSRCRRRTGTASQASAKVVPGSVRVVAGEDELRGWWAGDGLEKVFCVRCGGHVLARDHDTHEIAIVRLGALDGDPGVRPAAHQFVADHAGWEPLPDDGLPRFDGRIPATPAPGAA